MNSKKWSLLVVEIIIGVFCGIGILIIVIDPFFHYHAPIEGVSYSFSKEAYMNDGISKNFKYDAMITGTSMTLGFNIEEANKIFDRNFVRITYRGEGFKKINDNLQKALKVNADLEFVIRGVDPIWFISAEDWLGYDEYPEYLYDDNLWNDVNYLYNKEILIGDLIPEIINTIKKVPPEHMDRQGIGNRSSGGKNRVLEQYERPVKEESVLDEDETKEYFSMLDRNLEQNVLSVVKNNPDVTFYLFFPPYSICWWDSINQYGQAVLERRIALEKFAIEKILECENVKLFSFNNNFDLICDLNNYVDEAHYVDEIASQILIWMKQGLGELTKYNYEEYIEEISAFYCNYDYESIF